MFQTGFLKCISIQGKTKIKLIIFLDNLENKHFQFGENDNSKSFLLEIKWGEKYPTELPEISMDTFYNDHV